MNLFSFVVLALFLTESVLLRAAARPMTPASAYPPQTPVPNSHAPPPVQVDISKLLNARVVTTLTGGQLVPFQFEVDGGGGLMTKAAAAAAGSDNPNTLPDDGVFPATADHPEVVLHYSNADGTGYQVHRSPKGSDDVYSFDVPPKNYAKMFLFYTSGGAGKAPLSIVLTYQDGSTENRERVVPDWYKILGPTDKDCVYLAVNLAKWFKNNKVRDGSHHSIFGIDVRPAPGKVLTQIKVHKTRPIVVFWGATGLPVN